MSAWNCRVGAIPLNWIKYFHGNSRLHERWATGCQLWFSNDSSGSSTRNAYRVLGLHADMVYTSKHIRDAYYEAAKRCHPDVSTREVQDISRSAQEFIRLTNAYEVLRRKYTISEDVWQEDEEEQFRTACREWLGLSAEVVEESKRCPMFRKWLTTGTQSAEHWLNFLCMNGGLSPRIRSPNKLSEELISHTAHDSATRRRRR
jgi:hypothetical protein